MLQQPVIRKTFRAAVILTVALVAGVCGYHWIEKMSLLDALYMTVITMSTVGFEAPVGGFSPEGKVFVVVLVIFTIGSFAYTISTMTSVVVEGELRNLFKSYKVNRRIEKLEQHVIICGLGRNGREAALELIEHQASFVAIERDQEVIDHFMAHHPGHLVLQGDGTDEEALKRANIEHARGIIIALADDAANVFATLTARELNPKINIVARASNETSIRKLRHAGAHRVIMPNQIGGRKMARVITQPALADFVDLITGEGQFRLHLEEVDCSNAPSLAGHTLKDLNIRSRTGVLILGIRTADGQYEVNPSADKSVTEGSRLYLLGSPEQLQEFHKTFQV
jgi:voltage-gated potassium channel